MKRADDSSAIATSAEPLVDEVAEWLMTRALGDGDVREIFAGTCERLVGAGLPLRRALVSFRTLHPLFASVSLSWRRGEQATERSFLHGEAFTSDEWRRSPMNYMLTRGVDRVRRSLTGAQALVDFPVLEDLVEQGFTDYLAYSVGFDTDLARDGERTGILGSWATDRDHGFSNEHLGSLVRIQRRLAVALRAQIQSQVTRNVLDTYLGHGAGEQVLRGDIRRGAGSEVHAVIWMSDLRSSTALADRLPGDVFLSLLNDYFECTAGAVLDAGGEVLRFVGDSVLAIFPIDASGAPDTAPARALDAARDAEARLAVLNEKRGAQAQEAIDFGIGIHVGAVMFGNIGVPERLEFSVIGPAANEVARLEALTKALGERVLVSGEFATRLDVAWSALGEHELRGVGEPLAVLAPPRVPGETT